MTTTRVISGRIGIPAIEFEPMRRKSSGSCEAVTCRPEAHAKSAPRMM
jgi:hypothetical protein